jgi:hypothetical protein
MDRGMEVSWITKEKRDSHKTIPVQKLKMILFLSRLDMGNIKNTIEQNFMRD